MEDQVLAMLRDQLADIIFRVRFPVHRIGSLLHCCPPRRSGVRLFSVLLIPLAASVCLGQSGGAAQQSRSAAQPALGPSPSSFSLDVRLAKTLHSKKLKEGDEVQARTEGGLEPDVQGLGVKIPHGSTVIGHVTEAKARSNGDQISSLGIVFEKIRFHDGREVPIRGIIGRYLDTSPAFSPQAVPNNEPPRCSPGDAQMTGVPCAYRQQSPAHDPSKTFPPLTPQKETMLVRLDGVVSSTGKEVELDPAMKITLSVSLQ